MSLFTVMVLKSKEGFEAKLYISVEADLVAYKYRDRLIELRRFDDLSLAQTFKSFVNNGEYNS